MFPALKKALLPIAVIALVVGAASLLDTRPTRADIGGTGADDGVWFLENYGIDPVGGGTICEDGDLREIRRFRAVDDPETGPVTHIDENDGIVVDGEQQVPIIQIGSDDDLIMCIEPANGPEANVIFTTNGPGTWSDAACGDDAAQNGDGDGIFVEDGATQDDCTAEEGENSSTLTVVAAGDGVEENDMTVLAIRFTCNSASEQDIIIDQDDSDDDISFTIMCKGEPASLAIFVSPERVESSPALGNSSIALIRAEVTDASGLPVLPGTTADITVSRCSLSTEAVDTPAERDFAVDLFDAFAKTPEQYFDDVDTLGGLFSPEGASVTVTLVEVDTNEPPDGVPNHSEALALFHAEGCAPGPVTITIRIENDRDDLEVTATVTVIGPPAFITIAASPTTLTCGEKSEITVTVTDKLNQLVSDHTFIEVVTNFGGVLGGTGSSLTGGGPVDPLSNTTITLLKGTGKAFLLTSNKHVGQYEVLAASTGSFFGRNVEDHAPITAQVTVTCTKGTTTVTAPNTGTGTSTGTIRPPNTGDAGLAAAENSPASLFVIAAAVAFVLTAFASLRLARR